MTSHSNNNERCPRCHSEYGTVFNRKVSCNECNREFCSACFVKIPECTYLSYGRIYAVKTVMLATTVAKNVLSVLSLGQTVKERHICPVCYENKLSKEIADYQRAVEGKFLEVELISANYKGAKANYHNNPLEITTGWWRDRSNVQKALRVTAATHDRCFVNHIYWEQSTNSEPSESGKGTYYYTVWRASGIACNK